MDKLLDEMAEGLKKLEESNNKIRDIIKIWADAEEIRIKAIDTIITNLHEGLVGHEENTIN